MRVEWGKGKHRGLTPSAPGYRSPVRRSGWVALIGFVVTACLATGCVAPARSFRAYEGKAASTAASALSDVRTAILVASVVRRDGAFAPQVSVALAEADTGVASTEGTFSSIQPPDPASDNLRTQLLELLRRAEDGVSAMRIAARRGDLAAVARLAASLVPTGDALERFESEHGS
jgi:hypothetical protein